MTTTPKSYRFDTNAGPIVTIQASSTDQAKARAISQVPIAHRRGYSSEWAENNGWHVCSVFNTKGRIVHAFAIRETV
jgi:hypothetical protein